MTKKPMLSPSSSENTAARSALDAIEQIDTDTRTRKLAQVEKLHAAKAAIEIRLAELQHQLKQLEGAIATIAGAPAKQERRPRRDLSADRDRVARWMEGRRGQKFAARDLVREFPELEGTPISIFLRPLTQDGKIQTDTTHGPKRAKYFVAA